MEKRFFYAVLVFISILLIINPQASIKYAAYGMSVCGEIIIPSLFPFFICSGLLIYSGFCELLAKFMQPVMKPLFNVNGSGAAAFVLGIISGYPLGALTVCNLYEKLYLSKSEAERMLAFCNNSGPLFILGAVGASMFANPKIGIVLYISHLLSAIIVGIAFRFYKRNSFHSPANVPKTEDKSIGEIFSAVLASSVQSILTVCGAVVFFSVISSLVLDLFHINDNLKIFISALLEFSSGVEKITASSMPLLEKITASAAIIGFAGVSVHLQVLGIVSKYQLSLKPYLVGKALQAVLSACLSIALLKIIPYEKSVLAPLSANVGGSFAMSSLFVIITVTSLFFITLSVVIFEIFKRKYIPSESK